MRVPGGGLPMFENILILGGTREASMIASELVDRGHRVVTSLAGRTRSPKPLKGETRIGGFGGTEGLSEFLRKNEITLLVDATHPYATRISEAASTACEENRVRRLQFLRPPWSPVAGDNWQFVATGEEASKTLPQNSVCFLAVGSQHLSPFVTRDDVRFILRTVDSPEEPLEFENHELITGLPSNSARDEQSILERHGVTHIVCRNSGGTGAYAKLSAARELSIPVIMISRPAPPEGKTFKKVEELLAFIG